MHILHSKGSHLRSQPRVSIEPTIQLCSITNPGLLPASSASRFG